MLLDPLGSGRGLARGCRLKFVFPISPPFHLWVPRRALYDNMKTVIMERNNYGPSSIASRRGSSISPGITDFGRSCANRTGPRSRARVLA